jgi:hypothetical protein
MQELFPELFPIVDLGAMVGADHGVITLFVTFLFISRGIAWLALES